MGNIAIPQPLTHSTTNNMEPSNIINPPEVNMTPKRGGFWKQLGMLVLGTTVSLVLTFGTAQLIENGQRAKDRHLTALMVMSNIESFAQQLDTAWILAANADTAVVWLLNIPKDSLDEMDQTELLSIIGKAKNIGYLTYDKTTENIFSNNIETWKNMGNFQFIDKVGECFSTMQICEEKWNGIQDELDNTLNEIAAHPDQHIGKTNAAKVARDPGMRQKLLSIHSLRKWACYEVKYLRYCNRLNMATIGITEDELKEFMKKRQEKISIDLQEPQYADIVLPLINPDSLTTY